VREPSGYATEGPDALPGQQVSDAVPMYCDTANAAVDARYTEAGTVRMRLGNNQLAEWRAATCSVVEDLIAGNDGDFDTRAMYGRMLKLAAESCTESLIDGMFRCLDSCAARVSCALSMPCGSAAAALPHPQKNDEIHVTPMNSMTSFRINGHKQP